MVIGEAEAGCEIQARGFEASEELFGSGDAAEGGDWAVDGRYFHLAVKAPNLAPPTPGLQL